MQTEKYLYTILLIIVLVELQAQNYDYVIEYDYQHQTDSIDKNSIETERMLLLYSNKKSHFLSKSKFQLDTVRNKYGNDLQKLLAFKSTIPKNRVKFEVIKNFDDSLTSSYYENIFIHNYKNNYHKALEYELVDKDTILLGYNCKMAKANLSGRKYTLWYSPEISINDGPYKFSGLPGLVLEVYDDKRQHIFELVKIEIKEVIYNPNYRNIINASMKEIAKVRKNQIENIKNSGFNMSPEILEKAKKKLSSYNNPIELTDE